NYTHVIPGDPSHMADFAQNGGSWLATWLAANGAPGLPGDGSQVFSVGDPANRWFPFTHGIIFNYTDVIVGDPSHMADFAQNGGSWLATWLTAPDALGLPTDAQVRS